MPSLIIRRDGKPTKEIELEKALTLIGQKPDADIGIEDAEGVEERASILLVGEDYILDEIAESAGIKVNGKATRKCVLKDRDLITVGEYRITFQDKREMEKPQGIEDDAAVLELIEKREREAHKSPAEKKTERTIFAVLGVIVVGIFFWSYQSYLGRQAAEAQAKAAQASKAGQETKKVDPFQENARAVAQSMKRADPAAEAPPAGPKP
jgi:hypothetical protein